MTERYRRQHLILATAVRSCATPTCMLRTAILLMLFMAAACDQVSNLAQDKTPQPVAAPPVGELTATVAPSHYRLSLTIDPRQPTFSGRTEIDVDIADPTSVIWLHGKNLDVSHASVVQHGKTEAAIYEQVLDSGVSRIIPGKALTAGRATIRVEYTAPFNSSANALYSVERDGLHYAATQLQPIAARQIFPSFDDPGFKVPFDITITAVNGDTIVTTTPEVRRTQANGMTTIRFDTTRPLPTYLLAFVVGPYDVVEYDDIPPNDVRKRPLALRGIAARGQGNQLEFALKHTAGILSLLEEYFDIPYPYAKLDIIATPAGFGGAMENVGAIIYDEYLLLLDESSSVSQRRAYFSVHAHELAHMWFGDLVTPDWWTDLWLNESFATWMSYKIAHQYWPEGQLDKSLQRGALYAMQNDSLVSAREIREPVEHNDQIIDSFDGITYQKGGGVLGMIEHYAGAEAFRNGIRHHLNRYADQSANAEQFMESLAQGAELREIEPIFASFITQPGIPLVSLTLDCDASVSINLSQARYKPMGSDIPPTSTPWQVPVCLSAGRGNTLSESCYLLTEAQQRFELEGSCPEFVFPNAGGSGYYRFSLDSAGWQKLIDNSDRLSASEALSLLDSLDAAFRAGTLDSQIYLQGIARLINHEDWNVVDATTGYLETLTNTLMLEDRPAFERAFRQMAVARFERAREEGPEMLYEGLLRFMLIIARDPSLRAPLAEQAARYVGLNGDPDKSAVAPGQLETVLSIGVQDIGEVFFRQLLELALTTGNPAERSAAVGALARVEDPDLISRLQQAVEDSDFKGTEITRIMFRQMARKASTQLTYDWLRSRPAELLSRIPETFRSSIVPDLGASFCSRARVAEWQSIVAQHQALYPGYERSMRQAVETNALCETLRSRSRQSLLDALHTVASGD